MANRKIDIEDAVIIVDIRCGCGRYIGERRTTNNKVIADVDISCRCGQSGPIFLTPIIQERSE